MALLVALVSVEACSGDGSGVVPFDTIDDDEKFVDLNTDEQQGYCVWLAELASDELPSPGTRLTCDDVTIRITLPACNLSVSSDCTATVGEVRVCLPEAIAALGDDPCLLGALTNEDDSEEFFAGIAECDALSACGGVL